MKAYVKPELFYERYELSQHIANCDIELVGSGDVYNCNGKTDEGLFPSVIVVFVENNCDTTLEVYCETKGGTDWGNTFMS